MGQPKGKTGNPNGRPAGSKNERTKQWEALGEAITGCHSEAFNRVLNKFINSNDPAMAERGCALYLQACEYFKPKQARTVHAGDESAPITIVISKDL